MIHSIIAAVSYNDEEEPEQTEGGSNDLHEQFHVVHHHPQGVHPGDFFACWSPTTIAPWTIPKNQATGRSTYPQDQSMLSASFNVKNTILVNRINMSHPRSWARIAAKAIAAAV